MAPRAFVMLAAIGASTGALAEQSPQRPQIVLAPSATAAEPTGPTSGIRLIEDLDRPEESGATSDSGHWVIAPLPLACATDSM